MIPGKPGRTQLQCTMIAGGFGPHPHWQLPGPGRTRNLTTCGMLTNVLFLQHSMSHQTTLDVSFIMKNIPISRVRTAQYSMTLSSPLAQRFRPSNFLMTCFRDGGENSRHSPQPSAFRGCFNGKHYSIEWDTEESGIASKGQSVRLFDRSMSDPHVALDEVCDGAHGEDHEYAHSHTHTNISKILRNFEQPPHLQHISSSNGILGDSELSSAKIVSSMLYSTWTKGGAAKVVVCTMLMVMTKLVKVRWVYST